MKAVFHFGFVVYQSVSFALVNCTKETGKMFDSEHSTGGYPPHMPFMKPA
jgi:hypothetical protein